MIYNFNLGIGWASSGVEYAQAYRANIFRRIGCEAKFIFVDMFPTENIEHMTANMGFKDEEIMWIYTWFTDTHISEVTFTLDDLKKTIDDRPYSQTREGKKVRLDFGNGDFYTVYMVDDTSDKVHRVEIVSGNCLIRKDYYTYCRIYSEYYGPYEKRAHMYQRRFFNEDGSTAYEEINDEDSVMYKFRDKVLFSKEEFVAYFVKRLELKEDDILIVDRSTGIGQAILQNRGKAKVGVVVHADHYSESSTDDDYIRWNNYYEYEFAQNKYVDFYITATEFQRQILKEQFKKYLNAEPDIYAIPVGSIDELRYPSTERKKHSLVTASRLASEKHVDWALQAVINAKEVITDLSFDIYGKGKDEDRLKKLIEDNDAKGYISLKGHQNLDDVYVQYDAYLSASTSEGFGLSLLEAIGSGLPIIGFDVRYGNRTFVRDGENGHIIPYDDETDAKVCIERLTQNIVKMFTEDDLEKCHEISYEIAETFLTKEVEKKWKTIIETLI